VFYLANSAGKYNVSSVSAVSPKVAVAFAAEVTVSRSLEVYSSETTGPLSTDEMQGFVAGIGVAYAIISEKQRPLQAAIDCASENGSAVKVYGTVAMNYIQLCTYEGSVEGASSSCSNVERDNRVSTGLVRRTGVGKAGKKLPACGFGWAGFSGRQR